VVTWLGSIDGEEVEVSVNCSTTEKVMSEGMMELGCNKADQLTLLRVIVESLVEVKSSKY